MAQVLPAEADDVGVGAVEAAVALAGRRLLAEQPRDTAVLRTIRARYQSARPSRSRTPCTMPSPMNQWWVAGSTGVIGLGPLRR